MSKSALPYMIQSVACARAGYSTPSMARKKTPTRGAFSGAAELRFPANGNPPQSVVCARAGCSTPSSARKKRPQGALFLVPLNCGFPPAGTFRRVSLALARGVRPLPRHTKKRPQGALFLVPLIGVEPIRYRYHRILSPARLPIPPQRQAIRLYNTIAEKSSVFMALVFLKFLRMNHGKIHMARN